MRFAIATTIAFLALNLSGVTAQEASAKRHPANVFKKTIIASAKPIPRTSKSVGSYIKTLRKLKTKQFKENEETSSWKIYFAAFFARPLNDVEVTIKLYDMTPGRGATTMVGSFEQYLTKRGERVLVSNVTLDRKTFGVNRRIMMVVESRKQKLATTTFDIIGNVEKFSGEVDFTKDKPEGKGENKRKDKPKGKGDEDSSDKPKE